MIYIKNFIVSIYEVMVLLIIYNFFVSIGWFCLCYTPLTFGLEQWFGIDSNTSLWYAIQICSPITSLLVIITEFFMNVKDKV